jgi:hypothetical protein
VSDLYPEYVPKTERNQQACDTSDQGEQIVLLPHTYHTLEKLPTVEYPDAVQEHDQACQADWSDDLGLWSKPADRKTDEENRPDPKGETRDADLTYQVA